MSNLTHVYPTFSIADIRAGLAARDFTAYEITEAAIERIVAIDGEIGAFIEATDDMALLTARKIDMALHHAPVGTIPDELGPLVGVPVAFKDNMNLAGTNTTCASRMLEDYVSPYTATCVQNVIDAGALVLGKLNMDEFAFGSSTETSAFGPTYNPWDLSRVPGGSSGGSAAAVAAGLATVALGSDTGGSIRQPASFCGVVGYKPSYGMVSRHGVVGFGSSLDQAGSLGRSVADVAAVADVIATFDPADTMSQKPTAKMSDYLQAGVDGMRIGYVPAYLEMDGLQPEMLFAIEDAMQRLEQMGADLIPIELPHARAAMAAYYVIGPAEAFSNLSKFDAVRYGYSETDAANLNEFYELSRARGFGPEVIRRIMLGCYLLSAGTYDQYYIPAQQIRTLISSDFRQAFELCDALVTPTSPRAAFKFGEVTDPVSMYLSDIFTVPANIAGNGGMSLPVGLGRDTGLPVSVQILGPQLVDQNIFRVAAALESTYSIARLAPVDMPVRATATAGIGRFAAIEETIRGAAGAAVGVSLAGGAAHTAHATSAEGAEHEKCEDCTCEEDEATDNIEGGVA
ncbi:MAG: Asp-tRNA(Asn)/Glu-tRNA(Gln) amidotransferase subunit GatA [Coriobacteriia bacterium]|nr:Asp-tRNA(Asn)/Glu-tRNA(Gln) amidotransferase subunit GatA [Coriobacteriia bacterium]